MKSIKLQSLIKKHPWLHIYSNSISDYISPDYYDSLLKEYIFAGKTDIDLFEEYLIRFYSRRPSIKYALGLGFGSGRDTKSFLRRFPDVSTLEITDLSPGMHGAIKQKILHPSARPILTDHLDFMKSTKRRYDFIFTLWSLSHSIHQHIIREGIYKGSKNAELSLTKLLSDNLSPGGEMFVIHFDSESEEQEILFKQWAEEFRVFDMKLKQTPSKRILDKVLRNLNNSNIVKSTVEHFSGEGIEYNDLDEALEIFMNFHMETYFNRHKNLEKIIVDLSTDLKKYERPDGTILIEPGCFIYKIERL